MEETVIETIYGKYSKFEIKREEGGFFSDAKFRIYRDGKYYKGAYSSLTDAVDAVRKEG
jgi:hypothetical protein